MRLLAVLACLVTLAVAAVAAPAEIRPDRTRPSWAVTKVHELRAEREWLKAERRELRAENRRLRRVLLHRPSSLEALRLASVVYGQPYRDLLRVANCESPGLSPRLVNSTAVWNGEHATGLLQFLPSTFRSTPFAREDIFSPYANALAAGWMWKNGRRGEWACR